MEVRIGSYSHAPNECNLVNFTVRPRRSARGFKIATIVEAHCAGEFCAQPGEDEYDIAARVQELYDTLQIDGQDFGLYHSDGSPTPNIMISGDPYNITGNQILHHSTPASHNGEFSTGRAFQYVVRAEFLSPESYILDYQESIEHEGSGGPRIQWQEHPYFAPSYVVRAYSSIQKIVQQGYAITLGTWKLPADPILGLPYELQHRRKIRRTTPIRYPQGYEAYRIDWHYEFNTPDVYPVVPVIV